MSSTFINDYVNIILDFPIIHTHASVICQSVYACLHQTVNMVVFLLKRMRIGYLPKRESTHANV